MSNAHGIPAIAVSPLSRRTWAWPCPVVNSVPAVDTLQLLGLCRLSFLLLICHFVYFVMLFTAWDCLRLPFLIVLCPLSPYPFSLFLIGYTLLIRDCQLVIPCYGNILATHIGAIIIGMVTAYLSILFTGNWHLEPSLF